MLFALRNPFLHLADVLGFLSLSQDGFWRQVFLKLFAYANPDDESGQREAGEKAGGGQ